MEQSVLVSVVLLQRYRDGYVYLRFQHGTPIFKHLFQKGFEIHSTHRECDFRAYGLSFSEKIPKKSESVRLKRSEFITEINRIFYSVFYQYRLATAVLVTQVPCEFGFSAHREITNEHQRFRFKTKPYSIDIDTWWFFFFFF